MSETAPQPLGDLITVCVDDRLCEVDLSSYKHRGIVHNGMTDYQIAGWIRRGAKASIVKVMNRNVNANPPRQSARDQELHADQRADG